MSIASNHGLKIKHDIHTVWFSIKEIYCSIAKNKL